MDPVYHFVDYLRQYVVGIKLVEKKNSLLMRVLGFFCFFNKRFMTHTTTAMGKTIYLPSQIPHDLGLMKIIAHEYVHLRDFQRKSTISMTIQYGYPQLLALLSLFALGAFWDWPWIICLGWLIFLFPCGAPRRLDIEKRAYGMTLLFSLWTTGTVTPSQIQSTVDVLHGPMYYWPGGVPKLSRMYFETLIESAKHGVLPPEPEYADVWRYLNQEKYLVKPTT